LGGVEMPTRKRIPQPIETEIIIRSRRRCCICFGLNRDETIKLGQIAHLDHDPSNNQLQNLAFLCFDHHAAYDGSFSQSKNLTANEVKAYRSELDDKFAHWVNTDFPAKLLNFLAAATGPDEIAAGLLKVGLQITAFPDFQISLALTEKEVELMDGDLYVPLEYILSHLQSWGLVDYEVDDSSIETTGYVKFEITQKNPEFCKAILEKCKVLQRAICKNGN
jgi:hypothetical protein